MGKDVIIALDFDSKEKTLAFLDRFTGKKPFVCLLYTSPSPRDRSLSRMPSSA